MKKKKLVDLFVNIAKQHETCEEIIQETRNLQSDGQISSADYDFLMKEWDNILSKAGL